MALRLKQKPEMSQEALGDKVGLSKSQISRLETGETRLNVETADKIARALGVSIFEVIGADVPGLRPDVEEYTSEGASSLEALTARGTYRMYIVKTNVLDEVGVREGDVVPVNTSEDAIGQLRPMMIVLAELRGGEPPKRTLLLRQHVPPHLLVTNSREDNYPPLNTSVETLEIKGVLVVRHNIALLT